MRGARGDAVIVGGGEGELHLAGRFALDLAVKGHGGRCVGAHGDVPAAAHGAVHGEGAGLLDGDGLGVGVGVFRRHRADIGGDRDAARLAVAAEGDARAFGGFEALGGDLVEVERRQAGVERWLDPALPRGAGGDGGACAEGDDIAHLGHAAERAEEKRHGKRRRRDVAQRVGVLARQAQVRLGGAGGGGAGLHPVQVGGPDGLRGGIGAADGGLIEQGRDRAAGKRAVEAVQRLLPARHAEPHHAAGDGRGQEEGDHAKPGPEPDGRHLRGQAEGEGRDGGEDQRPDRPEGARRALGHHAGTGQAQGPDQARKRPFGWGGPCHGPFRGRSAPWVIPTRELYLGL